MTQDEIDAAIAEMRLELNQEIVLLLVASFEAEFQADFHNRVTLKRKDRVSRDCRRILGDQRGRQKDAKRIAFEEILDVWAKHEGHVRAIGNLKQLIRFRHWLAHGRYWVQKSGLAERIRSMPGNAAKSFCTSCSASIFSCSQAKSPSRTQGAAKSSTKGTDFENTFSTRDFE